MASVEETRAALETEQKHAIELTAKALSAIDTIVGLSSFTLTAFGVALAALALIGAVAVYFSSKREARKVAELRINAYIRGSEGHALIQQAVRDEVQSQFEQKAFLVVQPAEGQRSESSFPRAPNETGGSK